LLPSYAFGIGVAIAVDDAAGVDRLYQLLAPYRGHHVVSAAGPVAYTGPVELWLGVAARHLARLDDAVTDLTDAVSRTAANGARAFLADAQYELAVTLVRRAGPGDAVRARTLLAESARSASTLGMGPIRSGADRVAEELDATGPLTRREWEVAELVAQGLTNREIATRLYISERTAQNHVQHVLNKINATGRSQIAAWMTRQKMSTPAE
jgi:DNA-binding CsgD family transcriptional regulator